MYLTHTIGKSLKTNLFELIWTCKLRKALWVFHVRNEQYSKWGNFHHYLISDSRKVSSNSFEENSCWVSYLVCKEVNHQLDEKEIMSCMKNWPWAQDLRGFIYRVSNFIHYKYDKLINYWGLPKCQNKDLLSLG